MNRSDSSQKQNSAFADTEAAVQKEFQRLVSEGGNPGSSIEMLELLDQAEKNVARAQRAKSLYAESLLDTSQLERTEAERMVR